MFSIRNGYRFQSFQVVNLWDALNKLYNLFLILYIIKTPESFSPELLIAQLTAPFHQVCMVKFSGTEPENSPFSWPSSDIPGFCNENFFMYLQGLATHWHRWKADMIVAENIAQQ